MVKKNTKIKEEGIMSDEFYSGYKLGRKACQPEWTSVKERLPDHDGDYYTITEATGDFPACAQGTICIDTGEHWCDGEWWGAGDTWKVLYWAHPIKMDVPEELTHRPRLGTL